MSELEAYYGLFNRTQDLTAAIREVDPNAAGAGWQAAAGLDYIDNPLIAHEIVERCGLGHTHCVVDVGAGLGGGSRLYASTGALVVAVDLLEEQVRAHRDLNRFLGVEGVEVRQGDAERLPAEDLSFTHYVSIGALCHTFNRGRVLDEAFRVLRPGGRLEIVDFVAGPAPGDEYFGSAFWMLIPPGEYLQHARSAGFQQVHAHDLTDGYERQLRLYIDVMKHARGIFEPRFGGVERFNAALETYDGFLRGLELGRTGVLRLEGVKRSDEHLP